MGERSRMNQLQAAYDHDDGGNVLRGIAYVAFQELATRISHRNTGRYSSDPVADRIMARARHAMVNLDPSVNPYVHWLITGTHADDLPCALRPENFDRIRDNLPELLDRYGRVRDPDELKRSLAAWRRRRARRSTMEDDLP